MSLSLSLYFFGQVMSPHHCDQMSQWSQISGIALWRCSWNVFFFVIVIVLFFVLVKSCPLITLIKCLKGYKSLRSLCCCVFQKVSQSVSHSTEKVTYWAVRLSSGQLKTNKLFYDLKRGKKEARKGRKLGEFHNWIFFGTTNKGEGGPKTSVKDSLKGLFFYFTLNVV